MSLLKRYLESTTGLGDFLQIQGPGCIREVDPDSIPRHVKRTFVDIISEVIAGYYPDLELIKVWLDKFPEYKSTIMWNVSLEYDFSNRLVTVELIDIYIKYNIKPECEHRSESFRDQFMKRYRDKMIS